LAAAASRTSLRPNDGLSTSKTSLLLEAHVIVETARIEYNTQRPHGGFGGLIPSETRGPIHHRTQRAPMNVGHQNWADYYRPDYWIQFAFNTTGAKQVRAGHHRYVRVHSTGFLLVYRRVA
jgi:hypothetical protein